MSAAQYFAEHAIDSELAAQLGVSEDGDAIAFTYTTPDGMTFARRRSLNGSSAKVLQPGSVPLTAWWPRGRPEDEPMVLVCEGESDALAALSALRHSPLAELRGLPVVAIPGTGMP